VPQPLSWRSRKVFRCGKRWAELETYLPHQRLPPNWDTYHWLFGKMGRLHRELAALDVRVPRPLVATFAPPGTLQRWLPVTEAAVQEYPQAAQAARLLRELANRLRHLWVPATHLPNQLIHGDIQPNNLVRGSNGQPIYLDFGFAAVRPRVHDLAYALAFMALALNKGMPEQLDWSSVTSLVGAYEAENGQSLSATERQALAAYTAAVPLYAAALDGFSEDPPEKLVGRLLFLKISAMILANPQIICV
jgi:Ser/Thr protein kinase RdoA (MazF antagonist)